MRIATDIGGTFTDLIYLDEATGEVSLTKASTTPYNFAIGVEDTLNKSGLNVADTTFFVHGSTIIINALTERKGVKTGLITTQGFRDVLAITRANRPALHRRFRICRRGCRWVYSVSVGPAAQLSRWAAHLCMLLYVEGRSKNGSGEYRS